MTPLMVVLLLGSVPIATAGAARGYAEASGMLDELTLAGTNDLWWCRTNHERLAELQARVAALNEKTPSRMQSDVRLLVDRLGGLQDEYARCTARDQAVRSMTPPPSVNSEGVQATLRAVEVWRTNAPDTPLPSEIAETCQNLRNSLIARCLNPNEGDSVDAIASLSDGVEALSGCAGPPETPTPNAAVLAQMASLNTPATQVELELLLRQLSARSDPGLPSAQWLEAQANLAGQAVDSGLEAAVRKAAESNDGDLASSLAEAVGALNAAAAAGHSPSEVVRHRGILRDRVQQTISNARAVATSPESTQSDLADSLALVQAMDPIATDLGVTGADVASLCAARLAMMSGLPAILPGGQVVRPALPPLTFIALLDSDVIRYYGLHQQAATELEREAFASSPEYAERHAALKAERADALRSQFYVNLNVELGEYDTKAGGFWIDIGQSGWGFGTAQARAPGSYNGFLLTGMTPRKVPWDPTAPEMASEQVLIRVPKNDSLEIERRGKALRARIYFTTAATRKITFNYLLLYYGGGHDYAVMSERVVVMANVRVAIYDTETGATSWGFDPINARSP